MALFGKKGIDTSYERDLFERRVQLIYPEKDGGVWLPSDLMENIQRARTFSISSVIYGYDKLLERVISLMKHIEIKLNSNDNFNQMLMELQKSGYNTEVIKIENQHSDIRGIIDFEVYSILFRLKGSIEKQIDFQYNHYASQFIEGRSLEDLQLVEDNSISVLAQMQNDLYTGHHHHHEDEEILINEEEKKQAIIQQTSVMHITNGDIAYSHLNRQADLDMIVTQLEHLIYHTKEMIEGNIELLIQKLYALQDKGSVKVQLLSSFANVRSKHEQSKGKYKTVSSDVEIYASEAAYTHKKIKENSTEKVMTWLAEQDEEESQSFDQLAKILVKGIVQSERTYEKTHGSMTQLYKSESIFFANQIDFIQEKEKIRLYFSIIEELEDNTNVDSKWIAEYLANNGYRASVKV